MSTNPTPSIRRADLDWIRVGAFVLLIFYHIGMFYVPWSWHVKSPRQSEVLEWAMFLTNPWRLTLLFLVAGAATRFMTDRFAAGPFAWQRSLRLLPPLLLAMFVTVPPQTYYQLLSQGLFDGGYLAFWQQYLSGYRGWCTDGHCIRVPTWNHMWFVAYLWVYMLLLAAMLPLVRRAIPAIERGLARMLTGAGLLLWPAALFAIFRFVLMPMFPINHALAGDWYNHALSFSAFLIGFLIARSEHVRLQTIRMRWWALACWVVTYVAFSTYVWEYRLDDGPVPPDALRWAMRVAYAAQQWSAIATILGFGARHLTRSSPLLAYLSEGVFPFYLAHQTIIVVAAVHLARLQLPIALEVVLLILVTFGGCLATYELGRRSGFLRPLLGLKAPRRQTPLSALPATP